MTSPDNCSGYLLKRCLSYIDNARAGRLPVKMRLVAPRCSVLSFRFSFRSRSMWYQHLRAVGMHARRSFPEEALTANVQHPFGFGESRRINQNAQYMQAKSSGKFIRNIFLDFWRALGSTGRVPVCIVAVSACAAMPN